MKELQNTVSTISNVRNKLHEQINKVIIGLDRELDLLLTALLSRGHVLLEGVPGVAKTLFARSFAEALGADFQRIQFTPDLLPSDVTGGNIFDRRTSQFVLRKGPVFTQVLLADEINRSPAKTQSALLEAMQENQVTIDGTALSLPEVFQVVATQNPVEEEGVYHLPEAQLDRFFMRIKFPYPDIEQEIDILKTHSKKTPQVEPVTTAEEIKEFQNQVEELPLSEGLYRTVGQLAAASRSHPEILLGLSPRASLCLVEAARTQAALKGRAYVIHEDLRELSDPVLSHRLLLKPEAEMDGTETTALLSELFEGLDLWEVR